MKQKIKWIDVDDELPNVDFEVVVADKHGHVTTGWLRYCDECVSGYKFLDWGDFVIKNVQYWTPLPRAPK